VTVGVCATGDCFVSKVHGCSWSTTLLLDVESAKESEIGIGLNAINSSRVRPVPGMAQQLVEGRKFDPLRKNDYLGVNVRRS